MNNSDERDYTEEAANRADLEREGMEEIEDEKRTQAKKLIDISIAACATNNNGARIALYLDITMFGPDGRNYLPVMNIERDGSYAPFVPHVQQQVAEWFGASYEDAQAKVGQVNAENGITHDQAMSMVAESMGIAARERGDY